jgi:hypothetical protein
MIQLIHRGAGCLSRAQDPETVASCYGFLIKMLLDGERHLQLADACV